MGLVHVGLDLEHEGGEAVIHGVDDLISCLPGQGGGGHLEEMLQEGLHTEVGQSGAEEHRGQFAVADPVQVKLSGGAVQQLDLIGELLMEAAANEVIQVGIAQLHLGSGGGLGAAVGGEVDDLSAAPVIHALKILAAADGPVHRVGLNAQFFFQFLQQLKGIPGLPVHLVDEGKDGNVPHGADLEQLPGLGLHALGLSLIHI